jgi:acetyl esterase/lipase
MTRLFVVVLVVSLTTYFSVAAYAIHFGMDRLLFPQTADPETVQIRGAFAVSNAAGDELLVRRYGRMQRGCAIFFPGQHGNIPAYQRQLFPSLTAAGLEVFALSYPGQDGASGRTHLDDIQQLVQRAIATIGSSCSMAKTVFFGRSLGAMLAADAAKTLHPAGLVLEGAVPLLSGAVRTRLRSQWVLTALAVLPIEHLLRHEYSLSDALSGSGSMPVAIFQGTADVQAPLSDLLAMAVLPDKVQIIPVEGGTHSDAYLLGLGLIVATTVHMLEALHS